MKALVLVLAAGCFLPPPAAPVDWRGKPVKRVSATTVKNKLPFTIEVLASMKQDTNAKEHVVFGPSGEGVAEAPTIFVDDPPPETLEAFTAGLPQDGTKIIRTATVPAGWWVALSKPSHLVRADGSVAYTYWIHAQLGALTCEGFAYSYQDQLLRVAELCVSLQP